MNMSRLKRALTRGNKVVVFDVVSDPLAENLEGKTVYGSSVVFDRFADLVATEKYRLKLNQLRQSPVGARTVIVLYLEVLKATKEHPHSLNAVISSMADKSIEQVAIESSFEARYPYAVRAVYLD